MESNNVQAGARLAISRGRASATLADYSRTLPEALVRAAEQAPDKGVVHVKADGSERYQSYPELLRSAEQVLAGLRAQGLQPQDQVMIEIKDSVSFLAVFWGCLLGGMIPVPLHVPATFDPDGQEMLRTKKVWQLLGAPLVVVDRFLEADYLTLREHQAFAELRVISADALLEYAPDRHHHLAAPEEVAFLQFSSGSTGLPKGVQLTHDNLRHNICSFAEATGDSAADVFVSWMPYHHDMGLIGFHLKPLFLMAQQVKMSHDTFVRRPELLLLKITEHRGTVTGSPNFGLEWMTTKVKEGAMSDLDLSSLRCLVNGAEPISVLTAQQFCATFASCGLRPEAMWYGYGMAEACLAVTLPSEGPTALHHEVDQQALTTQGIAQAVNAVDAPRLLIADEGQPVPDMEVRIVNEQDEVVTEGQVGHIQIKGPNVTPGYFNNEAANRDLFCDGYLRTGDLGFLQAGRLVVTGRAKDVLFVNGQNFFAHDIEQLLIHQLDLPSQSIAACGVQDRVSGREQAVLFIKSKKRADQLIPLFQKIKSTVAMSLGLEIHAVIPVAAIPKTTSGKVERYKLRDRLVAGHFEERLAEIQMEEDRQRKERKIVLPRTEMERRLHRFWAEILDLPPESISIEDNFSELGGASLKLMEMLRELDKELGQGRVNLETLFSYPTIESLSHYLAEVTDEGTDVRTTPQEAEERLIASPRQEEYDLSHGQRALWFIQQMDRNNVAYNEHYRLHLSGGVDVFHLRWAIAEVVRRHAILRTVFVERDGVPRQVIKSQIVVELPLIDLSSLSSDEQERQLQEQFEAELRRPFDLATAPLFRFRLFQLAAREYRLYFFAHHIIIDATSMGVMLEELSAIYAAELADEEHGLPELPVQFVDYMNWQQARSEQPPFALMEQYWLERMSKPLPVMDVPTDYARPAVQTYEGRVFNVAVDAATFDGLKAFCEQHNVSLYMLMLTTYLAWLHGVTGETDLIVGAPMAGRLAEEAQQMIGYFVNTLPIRASMVEVETFGDLLTQVKSRVLEALERQEYPFDLLVEKVNPERDLSRPVLFNTMFNMLTPPSVQWPGVAVETLANGKVTCSVDMSWVVWERDGHLYLDVEFNTNLFRDETVSKFVEQYQKLLTTFTADWQTPIGQVDLLTDADRAVYAQINDTAVDYDLDQLLFTPFVKQAQAHPERIALSYAGVTMTYGELDARSNQVAHFLRGQGVQRNQTVAVLMERSLEMLVGLYGILKSGAAYVPIDPEYPADRVRYMIADSGSTLLLSKLAYASELAAVAADAVSWQAVLFLDDPAGEMRSLGEGIATYSGQDLANMPTVQPEVINEPTDVAYQLYTSGSTGRPKGVMIPHRAVVNRLLWHQDTFQATADDVVLQRTSHCFDVSVTEFFWPLQQGAKLSILANEGVTDVDRLFQHLVDENVTYMQFVPSLLNIFVSHLHSLPPAERPSLSLRHLVVSGEALPAKVVNRWFEMYPQGSRITNLCGPTEAAIDVTCAPFDGQVELVHIGKPIANTQCYIVNAHGQLCPVGVAGELYLGGVQLAHGYHNKPEQTAAAFLPNFLAGTPGDRLYRTGDLARLLPDGNIEYLGRIDHQVKVRGFRIELGEIEESLIQHPDVEMAVVLAHHMPDGNNMLVGFYTTKRATLQATDLQQFLGRTLPDYMVPSQWRQLDAMPLSPNGKTDRKALAQLAATSVGVVSRDYEAPADGLEAQVAAVWSDVLKRERVGRQDDFFEMGGHSLLLMQVQSRIRRLLQVEVGIERLFTHPTVAKLASYLAGEQAPAAPSLTVSIPIAPEQAHYSLSHAQKRLWFLHKLSPNSSVYHVPTSIEYREALDADAFEQALQTLVMRHAALRTVFVEIDGEPRQVVQPESQFRLLVQDLTMLSADEQTRVMAERIAALEAEPFDLQNGPLMRAVLFGLGAEHYQFYLNQHHIITDGWSQRLFFAELSEVYQALRQGKQPALPALDVQYVDYAEWQCQEAATGAWEQDAAYWLQTLAKPLPVLELPSDYVRPSELTFRGDALFTEVSSELTEQLRQVSQQEDVSLFMLTMAAYVLTLQQLTQGEDIIVGTPIAGRNDQSLEGLIGFFVNTLAIRTRFADVLTPQDLLQQIKRQCLEAFDHASYPFDLLIENVNPDRDSSRSPLISTVFSYQNRLSHGSLQAEMSMESLTHQVSRYDLTLMVFEAAEGGLQVGLEYSTDLFKRETVNRFAARYVKALETLVHQRTQSLVTLELLDADEQALYERLNRPQAELPIPSTIVEQVEQWVVACPDAPAVSDSEVVLSYRELNECANQVAQYLRAQGLERNQTVGILLERSVNFVVALLGVLKAGGAYLPLDAEMPQERIDYMLADSGAAVVLTSRALQGIATPGTRAAICLEDLPTDLSTEPVQISRQADDLAYVVYTSGSTGRPKGTLISDGGVVNMVHAWQQKTGLKQEVVLQFATVAFDACAFEVFTALMLGGRCHILVGEERQSLSGFADAVQRSSATLVFLTTAFFNQLTLYATEEDVSKLAGLKQVVVGGEALQATMVRTWRKRFGDRTMLVNGYGPTETTIMMLNQIITGEPEPGQTTIPIGTPLANMEVYVLNDQMQKCPVLVPGELYIGGIGLMQGYLNLPEKTAEVLVPHPFSTVPGAKLYRSGDIVRLLPNGVIEYLGRRDTQVKVRGFRVEISEIEAVLLQHPQVKAAAVISKRGADGTQVLFGFYTAADPRVDSVTLREFLLKKLPDFMVPSRLTRLAELPMNQNRKIDRKALSELAAQPLTTLSARPVSEWQEQIVAVWAEALQVEPEAIGISDNFFEIGGHSLLMAKVQVLLKQQVGVDVTITELFKHPTVKALAEALVQPEAAQEHKIKRAVQATEREEQEAVAIIGIGLRFPDASTPEEFWQNLRAGKESVREVPLAELDVKPRPEELDRLVRFGGFLEDIDQFDPALFGLTEREAVLMDPQQRLFLECAWEAFEDAGYNVLDMEESVSVYAGIANTEYGADFAQRDNLSDAFQGMLFAQPNFLATRVAYLLNLKGEGLVLNTACSTSLVTVHHACLSLLNGLTDYALAGGVSIRVPHKTGYVYEPGFIMSPDGHCRAFDKSADGTARGSGVGVVLLKRLSEAKRDGDPIYAVIKGAATNNDGRHKVGFTAPSQQGQAKVIAKAQALAGVSPEQISYVETHGSGTPLGDSIEVAALTEVFGKGVERKNACGIGSVKTNIGHADTAAGIASLIKTALALKHGELPPSLHFKEPNPELDLPNSPFYVNTELRAWPAGTEPRRAGVSSFGIGGTNAHVILEEAPIVHEAVAEQTLEHPFHLFTLTGQTEQAVREAARKLAHHVAQHSEQSLADLAYTLQVGRVHHDHRLALVVASREELQRICMAVAECADLTHFSQGHYQVSSKHMPNTASLLGGLGVALDINGTWSWNDALQLVREREQERQEREEQQVTLLIQARREQAVTYLRSSGSDISLVGANGPQQVIVSGTLAVIEQLEQALAAKQVLHKRLVTTEAMSEFQMEQAALDSLGRLWAAGVAVDWETLHAARPRRKVHAPTYPFQRKSYWLEPVVPATELMAALAEVSSTAAGETTTNLPTEASIRQFWQELLGVSDVKPEDNFFYLGAGSLNLIQIQSRINKTWGLQLQVADLFNHLTLQDMVSYVDSQRHDMIEEEEAEEELVPLPIPRAPQQEQYLLSHAQRRLYFLQKLDPESTAYTNFVGFTLTGQVDVDTFVEAYEMLFARHSVLRTLFSEQDGVAYQVIQSQVEIDLAYEDLSGLEPQEQVAGLRQRMADTQAKPFDLTNGPITRALLLKSGHDEYQFQMYQHHIINDGWSMGVFCHELIEIYKSLATGRGVPRKAASLQYVDYAHWQEEMLSSGQWAEDEAYWLDALAEPLPVLHLPTDYPRPEMQTFNGAVVKLQVGQDVVGPLWKRMTQEGVSMFMLILAAYVTLLHRYTEEEDIIVGMPVLGRPLEAFESMLGLFANSVAVRARLEGVQSLSDVLQVIREQTLDAMQHQMYPFDLLIDNLQIERDTSRSPLFSTMFVFNTAAQQTLDEQILDGLRIQGAKHQADMTTSKFDLTLLVMSVTSEQLEVDFEYNTDLFKRETIERMTDSFVKILRAFGNQLRKPLSALDVLPATDRALYEQVNDTGVEFPLQGTLHELFSAQAAKQPDRLAVSDSHTQMTYRELNERSNQVARLLREQGVGANQMVGIYLERGGQVVVAMLAVLKAGGVYVPLDPSDPEERIRYMLEDSQALLVLTDRMQQDSLPAGAFATLCLDDVSSEVASDDLEMINSAQDAAYMIYTSGSTGRPKGALLSHSGVVNLVQHKQGEFGCSEQDVMLIFSAFSFDAAVYYLFSGLLHGGRVHVLSHEARQSIEAFVEEVAMSGGTHVLLPTVFFNQLSQHLAEEDLERIGTLKCLSVGGEALQASVVRTWQQRFGQRIPLINVYGPTETTVLATLHPIAETVSETAAVIPIGTPFANTHVYVLNRHLQICPVNVVGELYIGGAGVGLGYWNRPETTAEAFLPHPFNQTPGAKLYKTGDWVRLLPDGTLDYVGRQDAQVKVRGYRVEIGEVEDVLTGHPQIREAVVIATRWEEQTQLLAYYTSEAEAEMTDNDLREWMASRVASFMVPAAFRRLDAMPLTSSGKIDRKRLPEIELDFTHTEAVAPRTELERRILDVWQQCIRHQAFGVYDNFFNIGGDSIIAMQVVARMNQAGLTVKTRDLLQRQTIAELAGVVETNRVETSQLKTSGEDEPVVGEVGLAPVQQWLFEQTGMDHEFYPMPIVLEASRPIDVKKAEQALQMLVDHHDMLRATYVREGEQVRQILVHPDAARVQLEYFDLSALDGQQQAEECARIDYEMKKSLRLQGGLMIRQALFRFDETSYRLIWVLHHLMVDLVTLRILISEFTELYERLEKGDLPRLPSKTTSYREWLETCRAFVESDQGRDVIEYWKPRMEQIKAQDLHIPVDFPDGANHVAHQQLVRLAFDQPTTEALLTEVHTAHGTSIKELLLTATLRAVARWSGQQQVVLEFEGHGRGALHEQDGMDLTRTAGWFTGMYPFYATVDETRSLGEQIESVRDQLLEIPNDGATFGMLRYLSSDPAARDLFAGYRKPEIMYNFFGQYDNVELSGWKITDAIGPLQDPQRKQPVERLAKLMIEGHIEQNCLQMRFYYSDRLHREETVARLADLFEAELRAIISWCLR